MGVRGEEAVGKYVFRFGIKAQIPLPRLGPTRLSLPRP